MKAKLECTHPAATRHLIQRKPGPPLRPPRPPRQRPLAQCRRVHRVHRALPPRPGSRSPPTRGVQSLLASFSSTDVSRDYPSCGNGANFLNKKTRTPAPTNPRAPVGAAGQTGDPHPHSTTATGTQFPFRQVQTFLEFRVLGDSEK